MAIDTPFIATCTAAHLHTFLLTFVIHISTQAICHILSCCKWIGPSPSQRWVSTRTGTCDNGQGSSHDNCLHPALTLTLILTTMPACHPRCGRCLPSHSQSWPGSCSASWPDKIVPFLSLSEQLVSGVHASDETLQHGTCEVAMRALPDD